MRQPGARTRSLNTMAAGAAMLAAALFAGVFYWVLELPALERIGRTEALRAESHMAPEFYLELVENVRADMRSSGLAARAKEKAEAGFEAFAGNDRPEETVEGRNINEVLFGSLDRFAPEKQNPDVLRRKALWQRFIVANRKHFFLINKWLVLAWMCAGIALGLVRRRLIERDPVHFGKESSFKFHYVKGFAVLLAPVVVLMYFFAPFALPLAAVLYGAGGLYFLLLWFIVGSIPGHL